MRTQRARLGSRWEAFFDLIAAVTVIGVIGGAMFSDRPATGVPWPAIGLLLGGTVLLVARRRWPLAAAIGSVVTSGLALPLPDFAVAVWVLAEVCLFSLPLRRPRIAGVVIGTVHAALLCVGAMIAFGVPLWDPLALILPVWTVAVVAFGSALRTQQDYVDALEERARSAAAARESEVLRRVGAERMHIARDLHDSLANSLAVINLESSNARRHLHDAPERAGRSLEVIRTVTKSTVSELAAIVTVLRDDDDENDRMVASTANLPHLIDVMIESGVQVSAELDALAEARLDIAADAALYRVVQEALTNAHRYGAGVVRIRAHSTTSDTLTLTVSNSIDHAAAPVRSGFGLVGMRERVDLAGGAITAEPRGDEFIVHVTMPITRSDTETRP